MRMTLRPFELPLRHVFTISRGSTSVYRGLLVELEQEGAVGYGEAGESGYYGATVQNMTAALESVRGKIENWHLEDPQSLWEALNPELASNRFAQCALDMAAHDLWGKLRTSPVWQLWGLDISESLPPTDYTIGLDAIQSMVAKLLEFPDWPVYKIKLGGNRDLEIIAELRKYTETTFRVDANCAWTYDEALSKASRLRDMGVELIEQPLPPDSWDAMRELYRQAPVPLIADESCPIEPDVDRCRGAFHGINVKLVKCGGLTPARKMLIRARKLGLRTMVGCMTETTIGISAAAQLLPLVDYADLDGALLLAADIATGVTIQRGRIAFPSRPGCGVELIE